MPKIIACSLADVVEESSAKRKLLICPDINYGREVLAALARSSGGWIGWEATNLRSIAQEIAFVSLAETKRTPGSDIAIGALVNQALDEVLAKRTANPELRALKESIGFRNMIRDSVLELRNAGVSPEVIRAKSAGGSALRDLAAILETYERLLESSGLIDPAGIFQVAIREFDTEAPYVLDCAVFIVPSLRTRGLRARLLDLIKKHGAKVLTTPSPPITGAQVEKAVNTEASVQILQSPKDADCFAAASPSDELREVFRRIIAENIRFDDVELVATDFDTYGIALDALCQQLNISATMYEGVPLGRTRLGRAMDRWITWLSDGLPADILRQALEAGELGIGIRVSFADLARELRSLNIGWGRVRYDAAIKRLKDPQHATRMRQREEEADEEYSARVQRRMEAAEALLAVLEPLIGIIPPVPERGTFESEDITVQSLAKATLRWLDLVPLTDISEKDAASRLRLRLNELAFLGGSKTSFSAAMAALNDGIGDMRAWPQMTGESKPRASTGGMVHLTDIKHAGLTGRARTFVLGLSADKVRGGREHALLGDAVRTAIAPGDLPTSNERRAEREEIYAEALASLRGKVTLSYAVNSGIDGREQGPAPIMLRAWRQIENDPTLSYEKMRKVLSPPASAVIERTSKGNLEGRSILDARDAWLDAVTDGPLLLDGERLIRRAFPPIDAGLEAFASAAGEKLNAYHGLLGEAAKLLDPRNREGAEMSPTSMETLAACPLHWFYQYGLGIRPPDDAEYDPSVWLGALNRGSLLHEVYETFTKKFASTQGKAFPKNADEAMAQILDDAIKHWRVKVPPPGEAVFAAETEGLRNDIRAFVESERIAWDKDGGRKWKEFEIEFGRGKSAPGRYKLPDGSEILITGIIDRIDELKDGSLVIVDYKSGDMSRFEKKPKSAPFAGGRKLQPALYAAALASIRGKVVAGFEYKFPSEDNPDAVVRYDAEELEAARPVISRVLSYLEKGAFLPTNENSDCKFCNYAAVCRVTTGSFNAVTSPRAAWAAGAGAELPLYAEMIALRVKGS